MPQLIATTDSIFAEQKATIGQLAEVASKYPYYKYNDIWTRDIQNAVSYPIVDICGCSGEGKKKLTAEY